MRPRSSISLAAALRLASLALFLSVSLTSQVMAAPGLPPALLQAFAERSQVEYLVVLNDDADLSAGSRITDLSARRQWVYERLRAQADHTQAAARALLAAAHVSYEPHYLLNALTVHSDLAVAQQLAILPGVSHLYDLRLFQSSFPISVPDGSPSSLDTPSTVEWNVARVHAPDVWSTYTTRGDGIVVGTADTGVQWDHPGLQPHYRGWNGSTASHTYNWHDAVHDGVNPPGCPNDSTVPCDGYSPSHGTHVTGIMVGDDGAGNQTGVAPGAQWIGCRNMDGNGNGSIARYTECFEFMLAPYPFGGNPLTDGRPDLAADIVNNSWTCTPGEGCDSIHQNDMQSEVQKLNAAGILVVAAAGNSGPSCSTVNLPIGTYAETFSVGATDSADHIAGFSSRGPVTADGSNRRKPDISAPGLGVRSTLRGNIYGSLSGTSMASPHVSGVAALLWSAVPTLRGDITGTVSLLDNTAHHLATTDGCGGDSPTAVPNNTFGYGLIDAYAAVACAPEGLCIDKHVSAAVAQNGRVLTYSLRVANAAVAATGVTITDHVPAGTSYVPGSISGPGADAATAPLLHWNIGTLQPLSFTNALTLSFAVTVNQTTIGPITNTAQLASDTTGPKVSNIARTFFHYLPVIAR